MATLLSLRGDVKFYDSWEELSDDERKTISHERLKKVLNIAKQRSFFYKKHYSDFSGDLINHFSNLPFLKKSDFLNNLLPKSEKMFTEKPLNANVFQSGGTTGTPKSTFFSREEMESLILPNARGFYAVGLCENDRVANMFATGSLYMTFIHVNTMLEKYGCMNFPFSNFTPHEFSLSIARLFKINCFTGISSVIINTLRKYKELGGDDLKIDKIFYGGEHLYESDKLELKDSFNVDTIKAPGYGTIDSWYIGYQCQSSDTGVFHVHDDQVVVEILDLETNKPCEEGEIGSIVVSVLTRELTPIIRYPVGDLAYFIKGKCSCGRNTPTFKLLGRGDDVLRIGFDSIDYNSIQEILKQFKELSGTIQLVKRRIKGKDELSIFVETLKNVSGFEEKIITEVLRKRPTLREAINNGSVCNLVVKLCSVGSIERNAKTGKLVRVVDLGENE